MSIIAVPNSSAAIIKAVNSAKPGDTLQYGTGHYLHPYALWRPGVTYRGAGIGKTALDFTSIPAFITGGRWEDMTIGLTSRKSFTFNPGAHDFLLDRVRLRSPGAGGLLDLCDFSSHWADPVQKRKADFHDVTLRDVELEYPGPSAKASLLNMWWDARTGGGRIYNVTFERLQVGVRNASGQFGQGGGGFLLQPSPPEHASDGPRPPSANDPGGIRSTNFGFDWSRVDHGSGKAAGAGYGFRIVDSNFVGKSSWLDCNPCDYLRAWAMCHYRLTDPSKVTAAMRAAAPAACASVGIDLSGSWFAGTVRFENCREVRGTYTQHGGTTVYHVPAAVKTHDHELYGI
jgi:hypothetical protein